jgi:hypothetical protein
MHRASPSSWSVLIFIAFETSNHIFCKVRLHLLQIKYKFLELYWSVNNLYSIVICQKISINSKVYGDNAQQFSFYHAQNYVSLTNYNLLWYIMETFTVVRIKQMTYTILGKNTEALSLTAGVYISRRLCRHGDQIFKVGTWYLWLISKETASATFFKARFMRWLLDFWQDCASSLLTSAVKV